MIWLQSSGSIRSASVVDPTTSVNMAVTGFRSPVSRLAPIFRAGWISVMGAVRIVSQSGRRPVTGLVRSRPPVVTPADYARAMPEAPARNRRRPPAPRPSRARVVVWSTYAVLCVLLGAYFVSLLVRSIDSDAPVLDVGLVTLVEVVACVLCFARVL